MERTKKSKHGPKQKGNGKRILRLASLAIFRDVSWMPNPIREAFLLNSDRYDVAGGFDGGDGPFCGSFECAAPPIFFNVSDRDRNSDVLSR